MQGNKFVDKYSRCEDRSELNINYSFQIESQVPNDSLVYLKTHSLYLLVALLNFKYGVELIKATTFNSLSFVYTPTIFKSTWD
jgi:hypothetical protein